ncbi:helix-turn-helix transcriptional regulator [Chondromyces apiculatus]|uniref:Transcriptional regulator, DeoR family n=1 Tax=Chondromyces apiculatus DSM 436 TaxID=1192034 RepID=A0A017SY17_9BACT|nr:WYL domain-containing protein [Chondromyces apiculatus]EYF01186.1 Transcriptional regulator, DeoR family [Chondromyces apiculatus DSM 436]
MRADRLLSLLMLLQSRTRLTAADLARRLEVSARTIYRDLEALSGAGVPVYASRGPNGGVALMEGWRTTLTGLTRAEVEALAAVATPGALDDIGLAAALESGLMKLAAALPAAQQPDAEHARQRLHVDGSSWFQEREEVPQLAVLRDAVWQDRKVELSYRDFEGAESARVVEPYGLVIKAERWYLVAGTPKGTAVFRGARVEGTRVLPERFVRPEAFDLPAFWKGYCQQFAEKRASYEVTLRLRGEREEALGKVRSAADQARMAEAPLGEDGWKTVTLDFERESIAIGQLLTLGRAAQVIAPEQLRAKLKAMGEDLLALYAEQASP